MSEFYLSRVHPRSGRSHLVNIRFGRPIRLIYMNVLSARATAAGLAGGFVGNGVLGVVFSSAPLRAVLYDPVLQSRLFREVTPLRDVPASVAGLIVLSALHGWFYTLVSAALPGRTWVRKGAFFGLTIWSMYWVFQEWFVYHTLLGEPILLNLVELGVLLVGALTEGLVIAWILRGQLDVAGR
jgi:hypothetical protein